MLLWFDKNLLPWCFGWYRLPCFVPKSSWCAKGTKGFLWGSFSSRLPPRFSLKPSCLLWLISSQYYPAFLYFFCLLYWGCCCSLGVDQGPQASRCCRGGRVWLFFLWWWKPLVCGHFLFCKCSEQLLIVPQPEVGLLLSWPGSTYYSSFLHLCGQTMPIWFWDTGLYRVKTVTSPLLSSCCN